jgi:CRP-like cAMP-binding protein
MFEKPVTSCKTCPVAVGWRTRCGFTPDQKEAGALVIARGERHANVFFVREGVVAIGPRDPLHAQLSLRGPRSVFGLESLTDAPAPSDVWAVTPSRLCSVPAEAFRAWLGPEDSPGRAVIELLARDLLHRRAEASFHVGDGTPRLARLLLALEEGDAPRVPKRVLARVLGMRPETVSRCLRRLAEAGAVDPRRVQVRDRALLTRLARVDPVGSHDR